MKMMVKYSPLTKGKYHYSKERKGVYVIIIYNIKILLPLAFDEQAEMKRYASTGYRTHDEESLHGQRSNNWAIEAQSSHIVFFSE